MRRRISVTFARCSRTCIVSKVVADDEVVFVTSANLTEAAFDRNIELGLLVRDRALALSVSSSLSWIDRPRLAAAPADLVKICHE
jgi:PLD-like domain